MQFQFIDKNFISVGINTTRTENLFTNFTSSVSRMNEFGLPIMYIYITFVVHMPYKKLTKQGRKNVYSENCIFRKYNDTTKVVRNF